MTKEDEVYRDWIPQSANLTEVTFPTVESERLRQQALMTAKVDQEHLRAIALPKGCLCLDVGCGVGIQSLMIADLLHPAKVLGVDTNEGYLVIARKLAATQAQDAVSYQREDTEQLSFADNTFDFVFTRLLLQHLKDPGRALEEMNRVLKPGGNIMVIDTDGSWDITPSNPVFDEMFVAYEQWVNQRAQGGNRKIGASLDKLLVAQQFDNITVAKELFNFDKQDFEHVVLAIFPPIKEQLIADGLIDEKTYTVNMHKLRAYARSQLESLAIPLYYAIATKRLV